MEKYKFLCYGYLIIWGVYDSHALRHCIYFCNVAALFGRSSLDLGRTLRAVLFREAGSRLVWLP
jgi:hypothetical protein